MAHLEHNLLGQKDASHPKLYLRYVDDIFAVFACDVDFMRFFMLLMVCIAIFGLHMNWVVVPYPSWILMCL